MSRPATRKESPCQGDVSPRDSISIRPNPTENRRSVERQNEQETRFEFIDINSSTARKQARAHVMREFMRQKRQERDAVETSGDRNLGSGHSSPSRPNHNRPRMHKSLSTSASAGKSQRPQIHLQAQSVYAAAEGDNQSSAGSVIAWKDHFLHRDPECTRLESRGHLVRSSSEPSTCVCNIAPQSPLDSNRRDPFQSFPLRLDEEDVYVMDHWIAVLPELMCNFLSVRVRSNTKIFDPCRDILLPPAKDSPIAFQALLAFAAGHLAFLHGKRDTSQSIKHRVETLRQLRGHFFHQEGDSEEVDVMAAMLLLSSCEDRFGDNAAAWIHMRACFDMRESLLPQLNFDQERRLSTYMNWVLITMAGYDYSAVKTIQTFPTEEPMPSPEAGTPFAADISNREGVAETINGINAFIGFLRQIQQLSRDSWTAILNSPSRSRRRECFQPGSALYNLLSSPPGRRQGLRSNQIQRGSRFAASIYINAVLLELSASPQKVEKFLKRLSIRLIEQELDWHDCIELLMWVLLYGDEKHELEYHHSKIAWQVEGLVNVAKRLSLDSWNEVSTLMFECLIMTRSGGSAEEEFEAWLSGLRKELIAAPLSSHLSRHR